MEIKKHEKQNKEGNREIKREIEKGKCKKNKLNKKKRDTQKQTRIPILGGTCFLF